MANQKNRNEVVSGGGGGGVSPPSAAWGGVATWPGPSTSPWPAQSSAQQQLTGECSNPESKLEHIRNLLS